MKLFECQSCGQPLYFENTRCEQSLRLTGRALSENHVKRAVELSAEKYCSASIMLAKGGVKVTHDYEIVAAK